MSYKLWQEPVPDLVLEIVSPRSGERDTREKPSRYEAIGIPEYWVFDPHRRWLPNGLHGRLLVGGTNLDAEPQVPDLSGFRDGQAPRAPLPDGATAYWSAALELYLYADGPDIALHDPSHGRLGTVGDEWAARASAEERMAAAEARAAALEAEVRRLRSR